jgi:glycosyltransferase involved in cell wall biosynthesis
MKSILVLLHCESNTGYAIGPLERTFFDMALASCANDVNRVHFAYPSMRNGPSPTLPEDFRQYTIIDTKSLDAAHWNTAETYLYDHDIDTILGFDQPVHLPIYLNFRRAGVKCFMSYWGAPMSSLNAWPVRLLKQIEVLCRPSGPDHYIFESNGMAELAVKGRGIPRRRTSVVHLGVDVERFKPDVADAQYVYEAIGIPRERRVFYYSGHMEERKGVAVIMRAANYLADRRQIKDWHILLCGNKGEESRPHEALLTEGARAHVTFGGYRSDTHRLQRGCYAALIASTGWDSFPRSGLEMQASGLPIVVSNLIGLREVVEDDVSGYLVEPGDSVALASAMERLLNDPMTRNRLSKQARNRVMKKFTLERQLDELVSEVGRVAGAV